jgi:hypothetical protein
MVSQQTTILDLAQSWVPFVCTREGSQRRDPYYVSSRDLSSILCGSVFRSLTLKKKQ